MTGTVSRGQLAAAISNAVVRIHSKHYGKGPTKAKTYVMDDVVMTVLQDVFTTVERTLIEAGKGELVREVRTTFQYTMRSEFTDAIKELTGREPRGFLSQIDPAADMAVEVFMLSEADGSSNGSVDVPDITQNGSGPA